MRRRVIGPGAIVPPGSAPSQTAAIFADRMRGATAVVAGSIDLRRVEAVPDPRPGGESGAMLSAAGDLSLKRSHVDEIESGTPPVLDRSTCLTSLRFGSEGSWGVCSDD